MCRRVVLALAFAGFACSSMAAPGEQATEARRDAPQVATSGSLLQASGVTQVLGGSPHDLDPDPAFGTAGKAIYPLDYPNAPFGIGLRVYAMDGGAGWYVLARHDRQDGTSDAAVIKVRPNGLADKVYLVATPLATIRDAARDPATGKFYFAGGGHNPTLPGSHYDFGVTCVDIDSFPDGGTCTGFGTGGTTWVGFNLGGDGDDLASRVVVRPNIGLILAGFAEVGENRYALALTSLYRGSGAVFTGFGTNGRYTKVFNSVGQYAYVNVFDMTLSNDPDAQTRLYVAGDYTSTDALRQYEGFVLALTAMTGVPDASFDGDGFKPILFPRLDCSQICTDSVSAITVQANGKLVLAGKSFQSPISGHATLGRLNIDGSYDAGFRGGGLFAIPETLAGSGSLQPYAIVERPVTRELLVALTYEGTGPQPRPTVQGLSQWSANGQTLRAFATFNFPSDSSEKEWSRPASLLVDANSAMMVGSRRWLADDWDVTLVRTLVDQDFVFSDGFE